MKEKIERELRDMQNFLEITINGTDGEELFNRIADLQVYMARSGELVAVTEEMLSAKKSYGLMTEVLDKIREQKLSASVQNAMLSGICIEEAKLAKWADRINRTCVHQLDGTRSLLSYLKTELSKTY